MSSGSNRFSRYWFFAAVFLQLELVTFLRDEGVVANPAIAGVRTTMKRMIMHYTTNFCNFIETTLTLLPLGTYNLDDDLEYFYNVHSLLLFAVTVTETERNLNYYA